MGDSVKPSCINVTPDAVDTAFQIHRMKRSAYTAVLGSFCAQSDLLSGAKEECLAQLRKELKILETEHREYLVEARSNKQMKSLSAGMSKGSTCNDEVMKDTPDLASTVPDGDAVFQIHCSERSAYASVLRAFGAITNHFSWLQVKFLAKLRNELRVSHIEHKEVLAKVISDENIKSLRQFSMANYPVLMKMDASFRAQGVVHDKIASTEQFSTSSTSCHSSAQQSPVPERSMPAIRNNYVLHSPSGAKEGSCFEPHAAKRLKSVCELAIAYLERPPSVEQLPEKNCTNDTLDRETLSCEVKAGCTVSPIFQEKHSQSNAGQVPSCVDDHGRQESRKRKTEVPEMRGSQSLCDLDRAYRNKENWEQGPEILEIRLTANLLNKVRKLFKENPDPANLNTAKSMLQAHEKDLSDALAKLCEVSKDEAYFSTNGQLAKVINHDEMPSRSVSPTENMPHETSANSTVTLQGLTQMERLPLATLSLPSGPVVLTQSSSVEKLSSMGAVSSPEQRKKGSKFTAEQAERTREQREPEPEVPPRSVSSNDKTPPESTSSSPTVTLQAPPQMDTLPHAAVSSGVERRGSHTAAPAPAPRTKRPYTKFTAEQMERMQEFARRVGWDAHKTDSAAVDAFCAQIGIPRVAFVRWAWKKRRADAPPSEKQQPPRVIKKYTAEQKQSRLELAHRIGWAAPKTTDDSAAVEAFCAQVGIDRVNFLTWMYNYKRNTVTKILAPPPPLAGAAHE